MQWLDQCVHYLNYNMAMVQKMKVSLALIVWIVVVFLSVKYSLKTCVKITTFHYLFVEFHGIDMWMLKRALQTLEIKNKAQMFEGPTPGDDSGLGVKFFSWSLVSNVSKFIFVGTNAECFYWWNSLWVLFNQGVALQDISVTSHQMLCVNWSIY